jgi:hypothetical protein
MAMPIVTRATGTAWTAFKSRTARTATAIGTASTAVWPAATAAITSATLWALETGAGIAADAGGVAREVFARSGRAADARRASLAGKQDDVLFDDGGFCRDFAAVCFDHFGFNVFVLGVFVF